MKHIVNAAMLGRMLILLVLCLILLQGCDKDEPQARNHKGVENTYDFRKSRWGDSTAEVKSREESDLRLESGESSENIWLIYKTTLKDILTENEFLLEPKGSADKFVDAIIDNSALESIPVKINYSFDEENRLHMADYWIELPTDKMRRVTEYAMALHGEPTLQTVRGTLCWNLPRSYIMLMVSKADRGWRIVWTYSAQE